MIKNTDTTPLVLTRVVVSCGYTKPEFETVPITPGKDTTIRTTHNPAGRPSQFVKTISVYSNGKDGSYTLRIKSIVEQFYYCKGVRVLQSLEMIHV